MQDFCMAQILSYSPLWPVRFESSKYWIWQLVMSKLHEGMSFQFWHQMLNQKIFKNQIFRSFFFKTLKFCTFWYIIQLVNNVDHFVDQMLTFSFSNVQISNDILLVSLIITEYNAGCHRIYRDIVHFKSHNYFQKTWKCHFSKETFFSGVSRFTSFHF